MDSVSEEEIRRIAKQALRQVNGVRKNTCDVVSNEISYTLEENLGINSPSPIYAPVEGCKHFVSIVNAEDVVDTNEKGYVIIDATIKQFEDYVHREFPEVAVIYPDEKQKKEWYDEINFPD